MDEDCTGKRGPRLTVALDDDDDDNNKLMITVIVLDELPNASSCRFNRVPSETRIKRNYR